MQKDTNTHWWDVIDSIEINCSITDMANFLSGTPKHQMSYDQENFLKRYLNYNWKRAIFISDPYDTHSAVNDTTVSKEYRKVGINLLTPKIIDKKAQIMHTRSNLYRVRYNNNAITFADSIMNARYPEYKENSSRTTPSEIPIHDRTSHYRTALEYLVTYLIEM